MTFQHISCSIILCFFFLSARGDEISIDNPDGLLISIVDQNGLRIYSNVATIATVDFMPTTKFVSVSAKAKDEEFGKFGKDFRTSLDNGNECNYALAVYGPSTRDKIEEGWAHFLSSASAPDCTQDWQSVTFEGIPVLIFENGGVNKVYPAFKKQGQEYVSDKIDGYLQPGSIRAYIPRNTYLVSPAVDIHRNDITSVAFFDPYSTINHECNLQKSFEGQVAYIYRGKGLMKGCREKRTATPAPKPWENDVDYEVGQRVTYDGNVWQAYGTGNRGISPIALNSGWVPVDADDNSESAAQIAATRPASGVQADDVVIYSFAAIGLGFLIHGAWNHFSASKGSSYINTVEV